MQILNVSDLEKICEKRIVETIKELSEKYSLTNETILNIFREIKYENIIKEINGIQPGSICVYKAAMDDRFLVTKVYTDSNSNKLCFDGVYEDGFVIQKGSADLIEVVKKNYITEFDIKCFFNRLK